MPRQHKSDDEILAMIKAGMKMSEIVKGATDKGNPGSGISNRIKRIAKENKVTIYKNDLARQTSEEIKAEARIHEYISQAGKQRIRVDNGVVLIGSDSHYHPGIVSAAHRAFVKFCREMKPVAVIKNGDAFDGASISRFPRIGWDKRPTVMDELRTVDLRMTEIEEAAGTKNLFWPLGNHDARLEVFLASKVPEFEGVSGFHLKDHFPFWRPCWSVGINDDVIVKHRFKSGLHAPHNNTMWAGRTIVTGHLHSMKVMPISDYNGTRFGVDCGTLAQPYGPQFEDYTEGSPVNWRSGFCVLTFWRGKLLWPELVHVLDEEQGLIQFRGEVMEV